ncbi:hypothetical protein BBC27_07775 [Acidithiobacillus ferrivorans]|uniref:AAA+ ATPase domain-containing protein n=1 Tax=Acidithiobacillus ferrivorans TaxID=160808 RepID=A0A1B9C0F9_9PROT|nr:hypothetical protein BBC27_07775 [Acidithiobacillus ferrivorans]
MIRFLGKQKKSGLSETGGGHIGRTEPTLDRSLFDVRPVSATGQRLAHEMGSIYSFVNRAEWPRKRAEYQDYLDTQIMLFDRYPDMILIQDVQNFIVVAGRYLWGTEQTGHPDLRYQDAVLRLTAPFEPFIDNISSALFIYQERLRKVPPADIPRPAPDPDLPCLDAQIRGLEDMLEALEEDPLDEDPLAEDQMDALLMKDKVSPAPDSTPCPGVPGPVRRLHEDHPELSDRWVSLGNAALRHGAFRCASPDFLMADAEDVHQWRSGMDLDFPHFREVTQYLYGQLLIHAENRVAPGGVAPVAASMADTGQPLTFPPLLLLGEAGIGKTTYLRRVARDLHLPFAMQSMAGVSGGFVLTGSDSGWKTSKPGWIFLTFLELHTLNPILMLDEVDKASSGGGNHQNVQEVLLTLLERDTATRFVDEYLSYLQVDLSRVSFVATANDRSGMSAPLLSRFQVMEVPTPSHVQRRTIARNVYLDMVASMGLTRVMQPMISDATLDAVLNGTTGNGNLRDLRGVLRVALGNAMIRASHVSGASRPITHSPAGVCNPPCMVLIPEDVAASRSPRNMGFTH